MIRMRVVGHVRCMLEVVGGIRVVLDVQVRSMLEAKRVISRNGSVPGRGVEPIPDRDQRETRRRVEGLGVLRVRIA